MIDLMDSPLRKHIHSVGNKPSIFDEEISAREVLEDVFNMSAALKNNGVLNIAVLGEVNAGKSTFVNALVGKKVAYTDVLEATATISEITYAEQEYACILWKDKQPEDMKIDDLLDWTQEMLDEADGEQDKIENIFSRIDRIKIGLNRDILKNITLVDTPGLVTITDVNQNLTNQYVKQTDYIIWILDARNLGAKMVNEYIERICHTGKPVICVVNKVDSKESYAQIKDFVVTNYDNKFVDIYLVSAKNAYEAIVKDEKEAFHLSGIPAVMDYMEYLNEDSQSVQKDSVDRTRYYQLQRELEVHKHMSSVIHQRKRQYDSDMTHYLLVNEQVKKANSEELKHWYHFELFIDEKEKLLSADEGNFESLLNEYANGTYLSNVFRHKFDELAKGIYEKFCIVFHAAVNESSVIDLDFSFNHYSGKDNVGKTKEASQDSRVIKGMKEGAILGVAFAGYSAWLGPAASAITFSSVLLPCVIPLSIGAAALAFFNRKTKSSSVQQFNMDKLEIVDQLYTEIKHVAQNEIKKMLKELTLYADHCCKEQCNSINQTVLDNLNFSFEEHAFVKFEQDMGAYQTKLQHAIEELNDQEQERYVPE